MVVFYSCQRLRHIGLAMGIATSFEVNGTPFALGAAFREAVPG